MDKAEDKEKKKEKESMPLIGRQKLLSDHWNPFFHPNKLKFLLFF